ncbi:hypothetical protein [Streptomyces cavernicola]|uniref:DUF3558 domain-containing protein n=1 Tax=Streptomyces cavernicola TaxID=3043613 RepID=A0ABT6SE50_9ACTN|nr:hypothetical protein [Streptomyces sp. B-S-A6]MDI3405952.1 hypothetical protein [Streptomyces sp. B-S-A6]
MTATVLLGPVAACSGSETSNPEGPRSTASSAPHGLVTESDAEHILNSPVDRDPYTIKPEDVPDLPGCPAYTRIADQFEQHVTYVSSEGEQIGERVVRDGKDTEPLEDLRTCSGGTAADGTEIAIQVTSAPGGPGNINGQTKVDGETFELRARVVDGDNIYIIGIGTPEQADTAIEFAVARYSGAPLPEDHSS